MDERVLPFAPDQIWPVLADVNGYPQWYPPSLHLHVRAVTADGNHPNHCGLIAEIPEVAKFQAFLQSPAGQQTMREEGLKVETIRMLLEFTP